MVVKFNPGKAMNYFGSNGVTTGPFTIYLSAKAPEYFQTEGCALHNLYIRLIVRFCHIARVPNFAFYIHFSANRDSLYINPIYLPIPESLQWNLELQTA